MELNWYTDKAMGTCTSSSRNFGYMGLNLIAEVGEVMGKISKAIRKRGAVINGNRIEGLSEADKKEIAYELGDVLWQWAGLCRVLGLDPEAVAILNLEKLADRQQRGTIVGEGDHR